MRVLKLGLKGPDVKKWQIFLIGQGFHPGNADGEFTAETKTATIEFQKHHTLDPDGAVGNQTFGTAMRLGFEAVTDDDESKKGPKWPAAPDFPALASNAARQKVFGKFDFVHKPISGNPSWEAVEEAAPQPWVKDQPVFRPAASPWVNSDEVDYTDGPSDRW